ncbi:MAG TPA: regulatory protein RecX [Caldisericia bacterium]|nr:regulatory protein RecX [Caldisericia bacterium]HOL82703.1 regulatory protein RecX [Caldisericia bacterium]HPC56600.1 regulatory protein RecX [Caldisericia bacterium]HPP43325.1 regulatory protein RecX [Caldisericia bacterium]HRT36982.1 regulatory protein RecX [Caldisericia bacterium]
MNLDCLNFTLKLLTRRDYFSKELKMKLIEKGYSPNDIDEVIIYLTKEKFIDDESLVERKINYLQNKGWGEFKIYHYLIQKGISKEFVNNSLKNYLDNELEIKNIIKYSKKKKEFEKKVRYLTSKGYRESLVLKILGKKEDEI